MTFRDLKWSSSEKKIARAAFDAALELALAKIIVEFKLKAEAVKAPSDLWEIEDYLAQQRRRIDEMFDYRYSRLLPVFARLIHEGYLEESRLAGLSQEKREIIRKALAWAAEG